MKAGPSKKQLHVATHKKALLVALEASLGIVTTACKSVGIERTTFYRYVNSDPEFKRAVEEVENAALDFAESQLHEQIRANVPVSTIFYLKTKGKKRGYVERQEVETVDPQLLQLKQMIAARAEAEGTTYEEELKIYLENYSSMVIPAVREKLASELVN